MQEPQSHPPQAKCVLKDSVNEHERTLLSGSYLKAPGKELYLFLQDDGNLCFYPNMQRIPESCIWNSGSYGKGRGPYRLIMQDDGNLVIYDADKKATWSTNTYGRGKGCTFAC